MLKYFKLLIGLVLILISFNSFATSTTYFFEANISSGSNFLLPQIPLGTTFSGSYTFNPNNGQNNGSGDLYPLTNLTFESELFSIDPVPGTMYLFIRDPIPFTQDFFSILADLQGGSVNGFTATQFGWGSSTQQTGLIHDNLLIEPPDLSLFNSSLGVTFDNGVSFSSVNNTSPGFIDGIMYTGFETSSIPEPSSFLLLGLGFIGLAFSRRKKII